MSILITVLIIIMMVAIDQVTKIWSVHTLAQGNDIKILDGVLHLHYLENRGAAWGIFSGKQMFLIGLTSIIIVALIIYLYKMRKKWVTIWYPVAFVLIISGAIGNLIDRLYLGYVRDFIYFKLINFPIFNVADIFVVCGAILLVIVILFIDKTYEEEGKREGK